MTEPNLDELDELQKECNINEYGNVDENGHYIFKRFREILANQVKEAKRNLIDDICDIEATREAEGKDFISWEAFERIKAIGDDK